jgi:hypothetical protein
MESGDFATLTVTSKLNEVLWIDNSPIFAKFVLNQRLINNGTDGVHIGGEWGFFQQYHQYGNIFCYLNYFTSEYHT